MNLLSPGLKFLHQFFSGGNLIRGHGGGTGFQFIFGVFVVPKLSQFQPLVGLNVIRYDSLPPFIHFAKFSLGLDLALLRG